MIKVSKISKIYNLKDSQIKALDNINLEFECGKLYVISGHSGSGKSTLLHLLGLLECATSGVIKLDNFIIDSTISEQKKALIRKEKIGFVFQNFFLNSELTAIENVMLPMYLDSHLKKKDRIKKATELLSDLGLRNRCNHFPKELSGGEEQRVAIARSLANNPKIILADEPTGNLDKENEKKVLEILKKLTFDNHCVIIATHSDIVKEYADEIINIENGKLIQ